MASHIVTEWYNPEKTVIKQTFHSGWELSEFLEMMRICNQMVSSMPHVVSTITVFTSRLEIPKGFISTIPSVLSQIPANDGVTVIVAGGLLVPSLIRIASLIAPHHTKRHYTANTLEEAEDIICQATQLPQVTKG